MSNNISLPILGISEVSEPGIGTDTFFIGQHEIMGKASLPKAHKHNFYSIFLVDSGSGIHSIDFKKHTVKNRMLFFLSAGQAHQWELDEKTTGYQLMFSYPNLLNVANKLPYFIPSSDPFLMLSDQQFGLIKIEIEWILNEYQSSMLFSAEIIQYRMAALLTLLHRWYIDANPQSKYLLNNRHMNAFIDKVEKNFHKEKSVKFYASQLCITSNYLNIVCKRETGRSASYHIHERLVLEAKRLLSMTSKDIKEITFDLGFNDAAHFSKFFKKLSSYSPKEFRNQL